MKQFTNGNDLNTAKLSRRYRQSRQLLCNKTSLQRVSRTVERGASLFGAKATLTDRQTDRQD